MTKTLHAPNTIPAAPTKAPYKKTRLADPPTGVTPYIALRIDRALLAEADRWAEENHAASRSEAMRD
jgi:hypothetical protein